MDDLDRNLFGSYLVSVGELYSKAISAELIEIYWRIMKQFPLRAIKYAINKHVVEPDAGRFFPKPADLVKIINSVGERRMTIEATCEECENKAMLINNSKSKANKRTLCFDHYMCVTNPNNRLGKFTPRLESWVADDRSELEKKYENLRKEMRKDAYEQLKRNYYASN